MNRNRLLLIGIVAVAIAGGVSWKLFTMAKRSMLSASAAQTKVVVASHDLNVGQLLAAEDLTMVALPEAHLPKGAFNDITVVTGRGVILPMSANEVVLANKIASKGEGAGLLPKIKPGMRAVSVKVNDVVSVAGFVGPGTRVDVIVTGTPSTKGVSENVTTTTTVLQNVEVLAAGKKIEPDSKGKPQDVPVMTLLVSPEDAQLLTLASSEGRIQLSLRNPTDLQKASTVPVRDSAIYGQPSAPRSEGKPVRKLARAVAPKPALAETYSVEIIRGDKRDVTKF
jgi:pilus assembly protein CpaB